MANKNKLNLLGIFHSKSSLAKLIPNIKSTVMLINNIKFYDNGNGVPKKQYTNNATIIAVFDDKQSIIDLFTLFTALFDSIIA